MSENGKTQEVNRTRYNMTELVSVKMAMDGYLSGDHYQLGRGWIGPTFAKPESIAELRRGYVPDPIIVTAVRRYVLAVVGKEPSFHFATTRVIPDVKTVEYEIETATPGSPNTDEQTRIDEADQYSTTWFDEKKVHDLLEDIGMRVASYGEAFPRLYINDDYLDENGVLYASTMEEALEAFEIHLPDVGSSGVLKDRHGKEKASWYKYTAADNTTRYEMTYFDARSRQTLFFDTDREYNLDELRMLAEMGEGVPIDLNKRLPVFSVTRGGIVGLPQIQLQRAIDHDSVVLLRNNATAAFRERIFLNAEEPEDGNFKSSPNTTAWVKGIEYEEETNTGYRTTLATPQVIYKDPVDQKGLLTSIDHRIRRLLESMFQAHILISGDATASGVSRQQAVQDHISSLQILKRQVEGLLRWMFETLIRWAAQSVGLEGNYDDLKCVPECRLSAVLPTPEERSAIVNEYNASLRSWEQAVGLLGTDDPDAEKALIASETLKKFKQQKAMAPDLAAAEAKLNQPNAQDKATA